VIKSWHPRPYLTSVSFAIEIATFALHLRRVAKPILGRGLGQLLEAHRSVRPNDGNVAEGQPPLPIGAGLQVLIRPHSLAVAKDDYPVRTATAAATEPAEANAPGTAPGRTSVAVPEAVRFRRWAALRRVSSLVVADVLLCWLAGMLVLHPTPPGQGWFALMGGLAVAVGAWLACEAYFLLCRAPLDWRTMEQG
jgi:hypothetical protein